MFPTTTLDRGGYSFTARLCAIIGFLGALPVLGAAFALVIVASATHDSSSLDRTARGTIHLERINRLIYAVVMESRGIYMSPDGKAAAPFADTDPPQASIAITVGASFPKNAIISLRRSFLRSTGSSAAFTP